jgi:hypothetical protein
MLRVRRVVCLKIWYNQMGCPEAEQKCWIQEPNRLSSSVSHLPMICVLNYYLVCFSSSLPGWTPGWTDTWQIIMAGGAQSAPLMGKSIEMEMNLVNWMQKPSTLDHSGNMWECVLQSLYWTVEKRNLCFFFFFNLKMCYILSVNTCYMLLVIILIVKHSCHIMKTIITRNRT